MENKTAQENQALIDFWDQAFTLSDEDKESQSQVDPESWKELAPSEKLFEAAKSLGQRQRLLDYGCGNAWASIIAAKSGCHDVTAVDVAPGAAQLAGYFASVFGVEDRVHASCIAPDWLHTAPESTYDAFICSNVLDVVPPETAEEIIRASARVVTPNASVIIGLNYYLSPEAAASRNMELVDGRKLYVNGVLRLVSRTDDEWAELFTPYYTVVRLEHFAWPGEASETRRLFYLRKKEVS